MTELAVDFGWESIHSFIRSSTSPGVVRGVQAWTPHVSVSVCVRVVAARGLGYGDGNAYTAAQATTPPPPPLPLAEKTQFGGLNDEDRSFTNLYGIHDPFLRDAMKRGDWHRTYGLVLKENGLDCKRDREVGSARTGRLSFWPENDPLCLRFPMRVSLAPARTGRSRGMSRTSYSEVAWLLV